MTDHADRAAEEGRAANLRIEIGGLVLEPLVAAHADAMYPLLADPVLYRHLDEAPPASVEALRRTYARRERRASPDGGQLWLNWVVLEAGGRPAGYVQATVEGPTGQGGDARIGYVFGAAGQGRGLATRATGAMVEHLLRRAPGTRVLATVDRANLRSIALLGRLAFREATPEAHAAAGCTSSEALFVRR